MNRFNSLKHVTKERKGKKEKKIFNLQLIGTCATLQNILKIAHFN